MKKLLAFILVCSCIVSNVNAYTEIGLKNFKKINTYTDTTYSDVSSSVWFFQNAKSSYEYDLITGKGNSKFAPNDCISLAETVTIAVRIHYIYSNGSSVQFDSVENTLWYEPYITYAKIKKILKQSYQDYTQPATRAEFAEILSKSIDLVDFEEIGIIADGAIPDVDMNSDYAEAVYLLYRAGILTGSDEKGTFNPKSTITRAEAATIISRIVDPTLRKTIELSND